MSADVLHVLVGEQLSAVVFVQNYLQLDFDGKRLTYHRWPVVTIVGSSHRFGEPGYRDALCALIAHIVTATSESDERVEIRFDEASIGLDLTPDGQEPPEYLVFDNTETKDWAFW